MRKRYGRLAAVAGAALLAGAGLTACGGGGGDGLTELSGKEVADRAQKALGTAKSVHWTADIEEQTGKVRIDLVMDQDGNCAGTFSQGEGTAELVKRGDQVWMRMDRAYWESQAGGAGTEIFETVDGRYLSGPASHPILGGTASACDLKAMQENTSAENGAEWKDPEEGEAEGQDVVSIETEDAGATTTMHVAATGEPYPVRIEQQGDGSTTTMTFTEYDEPVPQETPSAEESVDVNEIQEKLGG
ncbi:hypothetical protein V1J52_07090 [Streptomyces sp. TRM 70351]|uniref:hypothetical protein n=1 Tax=Streptomyces sp. TRM 70351 TaxID=3116552 RepID=UPI002E7B6229|nr:hypothetical protein [Streptomyces sp. TRM 70351]MEE1927961.1 hypothetical protein [Streptomyces sp. TRM 70351]